MSFSNVAETKKGCIEMILEIDENYTYKQWTWHGESADLGLINIFIGGLYFDTIRKQNFKKKKVKRMIQEKLEELKDDLAIFQIQHEEF